jgi:ketopantoate reductase
VTGRPKILVVGAGAVGTTLAAYLTAAGQTVGLLVRDRMPLENAALLTVDRISGAPPLTARKPELSTSMDLTGVAYLFLCVKYAALEQVLSQLPSTLPSGLTLVSTLNGMSALPLLQRRYPTAQVVNMTVMSSWTTRIRGCLACLTLAAWRSSQPMVEPSRGANLCSIWPTQSAL